MFINRWDDKRVWLHQTTTILKKEIMLFDDMDDSKYHTSESKSRKINALGSTLSWNLNAGWNELTYETDRLTDRKQTFGCGEPRGKERTRSLGLADADCYI